MSRQLVGVLMVIVNGLFMGVLWTLTIERVPVWQSIDLRAFAVDFGQSIRRVDLVQPAGAVLSVVFAAGYATTVGGTSRVLTVIAGVLLVVVIVISAGVGVPMQKPFRSAEGGDGLPAGVDVAGIRQRWIRIHLVRTLLGVVAFGLLVVAAIYP